MVRSEIQGAEYSVGRVFSDDFLFSIPGYQRPYAWTPEQAGELLEDLLGVLEGAASAQDVEPYFLGSIVLIKGSTSDAQVVDGQQRLTTLTILLAVLRALLPPAFSDGITPYLYQQGNPIAGIPVRYRLSLRERDAAFFQQYVQGMGGPAQLEGLTAVLPDSQRNIRDNTLLYLRQLANISEEQRVFLAQFIITRCFLVVVSTPNQSSAYRIFSILNDRGLDLSLSDILKAEVVGQVPSAEQESYTELWEDGEQELGRKAFEDLFAHIRTIYRRTKARNTLTELRQYVLRDADPRAFINDTVLPLADAFAEIRHCAYQSVSRADEVNALFRWLRQVDNIDWQPPAIYFLRANRNQQDALITFFADLERLAMSFMIRGVYVNQRLERYARLLDAIDSGVDLRSDDSPLQLTDAEIDQTVTVLDGDLYSNAKIRMPVLLRLDAALSAGEASYDYPALSVEHVLPQTPPPGSQWLRWWPDSVERAGWLNRLGNLTLLSRRKNSAAQNYDLEQKRSTYFTNNGVSAFALTTQILQVDEWTPEAVQQRHNQLIAALRAVWRL